MHRGSRVRFFHGEFDRIFYSRRSVRKYSHTNSYNFARTLISQDDHLKLGPPVGTYTIKVICRHWDWLRFVTSLPIPFYEWMRGKLPTYFSMDAKCLNHNLSMISCKLVHPFFPSRPHYLKAEAKSIRADIYHSSFVFSSSRNTLSWAAND